MLMEVGGIIINNEAYSISESFRNFPPTHTMVFSKIPSFSSMQSVAQAVNLFLQAAKKAILKSGARPPKESVDRISLQRWANDSAQAVIVVFTDSDVLKLFKYERAIASFRINNRKPIISTLVEELKGKSDRRKGSSFYSVPEYIISNCSYQQPNKQTLSLVPRPSRCPRVCIVEEYIYIMCV